jgi:hypothetical protein
MERNCLRKWRNNLVLFVPFMFLLFHSCENKSNNEEVLDLIENLIRVHEKMIKEEHTYIIVDSYYKDSECNILIFTSLFFDKEKVNGIMMVEEIPVFIYINENDCPNKVLINSLELNRDYSNFSDENSEYALYYSHEPIIYHYKLDSNDNFILHSKRIGA